MTRPLVHEVNCATNESIVREMNDEEFEQYQKDQIAWQEQKAIQQSELEAKEASRVSAFAKLAALGLTEEEAKAIAG